MSGLVSFLLIHSIKMVVLHENPKKIKKESDTFVKSEIINIRGY